jgi:hypothetical protein
MNRTFVAAVLAMAASCGSKPEKQSKPAFTDVAESSGLHFVHYPGLSGKFYMPEIMGSGVALLDFDNDGDLDVYLLQGMPLDAATRPPRGGRRLGNRLFRNELTPSGRLSFTDVTEAAGAGKVMYAMGVATGDFNNDGFVDLYITGFGLNVLYRNNGNGTFTDVTSKAGVQDERWSTSAAFFDYDRDGNLDLFVLNYVDFTVAGNKACQAPSGEADYCTPKAYRPVPARLFHNEGNGRFRDVTSESGIAKAYGPGLGITVSDVNRDGWLDMYVANDTAANLLWINQGNGTFRESGLIMGAAYSEDGLAKAGMGVTAGDFDNDGDDDLVVVNLTREGATLFANDGKGNYQDMSLRLGIRPATFSYTGFGADWLDVDNDGWLDLFIANGAVTLIEAQRGQPYPFLQKNQVLRNIRGSRFQDVTSDCGPGLQLSEVSRGAAFGDIDNDGDIDIVVTNNNGPVRLLRNDGGSEHPWFRVELIPPSGAGPSQGAQVGIHRSGEPTLWRRAHTDSSYLSASDPRVHFGLGNNTPVERVEVVWPGGSRESFPGAPAGNSVRVRKDVPAAR